ncbi:hypothetical protein Golax_000778 [Gossypium laxum]|uniref:Uncharacterized protein n=1 Tax=Gossypium laxum TaxID=34288 RepID=A0A7J9AUT4_9ROSI|nr:hypothetical protein [Gossypium laxum]
MMVAESMVKLGLGKDKLGSSKSEERSVCEKDHKEDDDYNGEVNSGNWKPRVGNKKPNRKIDKLKCFLCDGSHMLKTCLKKSALSTKKKPVGKALRLGSSKCPKKSVIERDDGKDKEPKKLGSSKGKVKAKREKMSKKKTTLKLVESSKELPHEEDVSFSSNLGEKFVMKAMKLGPMRPNSSKATKLSESSTRLSPMEKVRWASDSKEKVVMQVGQLTQVNTMRKVHSEHFDSVLHSNLLTWQEHRGAFKVLKQGG